MWSNYSTPSLVIRLSRDRSPKFLFDEIQLTIFTTRRKPNTANFYDNSEGKIGKLRLSNGLINMSGLSQWLYQDLSVNAIRKMLKKDLNFDS